MSQKKIAVVMGSSSDWQTMKETCTILDKFEIAYHKEVVSAHRTPELMFEFARNAAKNGYQIIIAGAGGSAHLPGMIAALTTLPVLGVPVESKALKGMDSLLSIVQMPGGIPVATLAIGTAGAKNAAILALRILALNDPAIREKLDLYADELKKQAQEGNRDLI